MRGLAVPAFAIARISWYGIGIGSPTPDPPARRHAESGRENIFQDLTHCSPQVCILLFSKRERSDVELRWCADADPRPEVVGGRSLVRFSGRVVLE